MTPGKAGGASQEEVLVTPHRSDQGSLVAIRRDVGDVLRNPPAGMNIRQAGLVESRKDGRWMYYCLPGSRAPSAVRQAIQWTRGQLTDDPQIKQDQKILKTILKTDPEVLCRRQTRS